MGKHAKLEPPKAAKAAKRPRPRVSGDPVVSMLDDVTTHLTRLLSSIEATLAAGTATPALARESAGVARAIIQLSSEQRARKRSERLRLEDLGVSGIIEFLRQCSGEELQRVRGVLNRILSNESVLG